MVTIMEQFSLLCGYAVAAHSELQSQVIMYQACNDRIGYFFVSYDAAKALADDLPEGLVKGLTGNHDWIEIKDLKD